MAFRRALGTGRSEMLNSDDCNADDLKEGSGHPGSDKTCLKRWPTAVYLIFPQVSVSNKSRRNKVYFAHVLAFLETRKGIEA